MAKNLKINIKNTQLAEALQLKPTLKKKTAEKAGKTATKKPVRRGAAVVKRAGKNIAAEKKPDSPKPDTTLHQKAHTASASEKKEDLLEEAIVIRRPTPEKTEAKAAPSSPTASKSDKSAATDKQWTKPSATNKPEKGKKEAKPIKRFETFRPFDSRDRQGLRNDEEQAWRKRRYGSKNKGYKKVEQEVVRPSCLTIRIPITIKDLAQEMKRKASELIAILFKQGVIVTINDYLDDETTIELLGHELDCAITLDTSEEKRLQITDKTIEEEIKETDETLLTRRSPIVTFMGHVDHGKTSLIDAIRKSSLASAEAGAITQHIGAFTAQTEQGSITILDTPGHEAFTLMRERGATITDIVVLVIAGDEGMKMQTEEALRLAKEAKVPIIVAINKCDKEGFDVELVYRQLSEKELLPEAWGGQTITINCSAVTKEGINQLLEMVLLQSDMLELKANPKARARGSVLESELHKGLGATATLLIQTGTLKKGDALVIDKTYGRVKTMHDEHGKLVEQALPSSPVKITGLSAPPEAGCEFVVVGSEKQARKLCEERQASQVHRSMMKSGQREGMEMLLQRHSEQAQKKIVNLIIRADVQGSVEAIKNSLLKIPSKKVDVNIVSAEVGEISESDIELAAASDASIVGFHTQVESHAASLIQQEKIHIIQHDIIYHIIDDVKALMKSKLDKIRVEQEVGQALIQQVFKASKVGSIAGCIVTKGNIKRSHLVKVMREKAMLFSGNIASLKRVNEDVKEVQKDIECGIVLEKFQDIQQGDVLHAFEVTWVEQDL